MKMVEGPQNPPSSLLFPVGDVNVLLDLGSLLLSFKEGVPTEAVPKIQVPYRMAAPLQGVSSSGMSKTSTPKSPFTA